MNQPIPWYIADPLIGLTLPALLIIGNKTFGISSSMRHICASCVPGDISFFNYNWKKEIWNLFFVAGIFIGGFIAGMFLSNSSEILIYLELKNFLAQNGITNLSGLVPSDLFNWTTLFTLKGFFMMVVSGFLVGFGMRYAGGCTSGHAIMGLSNLQWPSLVATICFMMGGFISTWVIVPFILSL